MIFTRLLLGDCVVQVVRIALHHSPDILLADKDDEDPNSLQRKSLVNARCSIMLHLLGQSYLAHIQGVCENQPTRREGKVEDLKVPGDSHAKEETQVYQHLVPPLVGAVTAARARTTNM